MKESKFLTELRDTFRNHGAFFYKIVDMPHFKGKMTRFDAPKPFDSMIVLEGIPIAIEAKIFKKFQAFGIRHLRPSQVEGLEAFEQAGGRSFVFLNVRIKAVAGEQKHVNRLYIFKWEDIRDAKASFKKAILEFELPFYDGAKGLFDLDDWILKQKEKQ